MTPPDRIAILNQLFRRLSASLPVYGSQVQLWVGPGEEQAAETISRMAADDQRLAHRLAEAIRRAGGRPIPGTFPPEYTSLHDVSARYVLGQTLPARKRDLAEVRCWALQLGDAVPEWPLVHEILATLEAHVRTLETLASQSQSCGQDAQSQSLIPAQSEDASPDTG